MGFLAKKLTYKIPFGIKNAGFLQQAVNDPLESESFQTH